MIHRSFKKIRIKTGGSSTKLGSIVIQEKLERKSKLASFVKNELCLKGITRAKEELEEIETWLVETCAEKNANLIKLHMKSMEKKEGQFCQLKLWKLKNKICPPKQDPPMGNRDESGSFISAPNLLKSLYLRTYSKRLEHRPMKEELMDILFLKEELWSLRLEEMKGKKTLQ